MCARSVLDTQAPLIFEQWRQSGREVAVVGLAKSGVAASRLLRRRGVRVYASDSGQGAELEARIAELRTVGAEAEAGGHDLERIKAAAAVVVSPGVPPDAPPLAAARGAGATILSEIDVGYLALAGVSFAGITGTNGKTTTTALVAHLLKAIGKRAEAAGNIGRPLSLVALEPARPEWLAVELSSFQLHDIYHFTPRVGVLTNLAPDHLDRYRNLEDYYADKARLFARASAESVWVTNADDGLVQRMAGGKLGTAARFSVLQRADAWFDHRGAQLMLGDQPLLSRRELLLLGDHNVANALAAVLVAHHAGGSIAEIADGLRSFRALAHRLEPVREVDGVLWINDSKATNVASTAVALQALDRPFVLLLGGRHKGQPYTSLISKMGDRCRAVIAYGEARDLIVNDLGDRVLVVLAGRFADVLGKARQVARRGDAVLLSPACSSYDMFKDYEDRGAQFRAAVEAM